MSLNPSRSRRLTEGTSSGKRGRPESLVRQFWEDIDVAGVGPKCVFCEHRSVTRMFRAPPATRHTLICKNAPEDVKAQLRRVTNNKYSRRRPTQDISSSKPQTSLPPPHRTLPNPSPPPQQQTQQPPQQSLTTTQQHHAAPPSQQQHQPPHFSFVKHPSPTAADNPHHDNPTLASLASPRHISANAVTAMTSPPNLATAAVDTTSVVPANMRTALLNDTRNVAAPRSLGLAPAHTVPASLSPAADLLYATGGATAATRLLPHDDLSSQVALERANAQAALVAAVIEALFPHGGGKKEAEIPTPAEFRAALQEIKESARNKAKRQRNEAKEEVVRLQNAISLLVGSKTSGAGGGGGHGRGMESVESDESDDEGRLHVSVGGRREWSNGYDRAGK